ncbi:aldehyde ferredoxin oxidoreductase family protein [Pseudodesulfovibrio indicus]|jgi:aldehyde:ferredoxin oxidoreductase|uniref:Aldehyde ferredoxin oxidoreductase n=1 Tax=Pseudodesulfovibrio indicus TaxID=1716143 RepID=A0A126QMX0_9BACT|nr:aldehyde ferredoxin oxidoreductase C-terminal domain-containing protein [Pseudodesulfovibrio indicus]AMK11234.1 aldehyde ferredoxin oxidoreductase [Pseudodesulfovibrio indicus]TDT92261.1 aldehyde:ferredoxin oxidoreductase [Pseudodesulfovibrio indicus]
MSGRFGWTGTVLCIDLTSGAITLDHPDDDLYRAFLGGRGLAGHYLRPFAAREHTDPDLPLLIFTGPLTGTDSPTSGRGTIMTRSPLTGAICDGSIGGGLPTRLKKAGFDGLVITGRGNVPCGIEIDDAGVRVVETDLWGRDTDAVLDTLEQRLPEDTSLACIGPAAENGSPLATVAVDHRHGNVRGGLGLVFAAKNLKYLTVRGTGDVPVRDPDGLAEARRAILRLTAASPVLMGRYGFSEWGTGALYDLMDARRMMPTDNFRRTRFEHAADTGAAAIAKRYSPRAHGCLGCHIRCRRIAGTGHAMPGYETLAHFTALIGNPDPDLALLGADICSRLGLETVSTAATLACLREHTGQDFNAKSLRTALHDMAEGGDLGRGAAFLARTLGTPDTAMTVKGLELPAYDPRGAMGLALSYAVSTRGGCHQRAFSLSHEILRKPVATDRFSFSGKARIIKLAEDGLAAADSMNGCRLIFLAAGLEEYAKVLEAVTGLEFSAQSLLETGERITVNERLMNVANGFTVADDDLPQRFFTEPGTSGPGMEIKPIDRDEFLRALNNYYAVRGLDPSGQPTDRTLERLGLTR